MIKLWKRILTWLSIYHGRMNTPEDIVKHELRVLTKEKEVIKRGKYGFFFVVNKENKGE